MREKATSRILIVEDEGVVTKDIQHRLERLGHAVVGIAYSGDKAVETAGRLSPDLVLMDIKLRGDMDGIEAARQIRDRFNIPVVYLTAYTDDMILKFAKIAEPYGYIVKPFGDRELHTNIDMALYKHKAEETLKESEEKFRSFTQNAPDFIFQLDRDGMILFTNRTYGDVSVENVIGTSIFAWLEEEFRPAFRTALTHVFETAKPQVLEYEALGPEGETRWYSGHIGQIKAKEQVGSLILIARDVTERKKAEEELKQSREFIANVINALDDPVFVKDEEHRWAVLNDAACEVMGRPREELIGKTDYDLFPKEQADVFWERDNHVLNNGGTDVNEEEITWHGKLHTISTKKSIFKDSSTGKKFIAGTIRDITERKRAEEALRKSERKYRALFESTKDGIIMTNMQGKILDANQAYLDMLGYNLEELGKITYQELTPKKWHEMEAEIVKNQFIKRGYSDEYEKEYMKKDGTIFPISIKGWLVRDEQGQPIGMWGFIRDITERKKAEDTLRKSEDKYRKVTENSLTGIFIHQDDKYVFVNDRFAEIHGYGREELLGKTFWDLIHPGDWEMSANIRARRLGGEKVPLMYDIRRVKKDGETIWCQAIISQIEYKERPAAIGNVIDITERKKAEEALKIRAQILENMVEGVNVSDDNGVIFFTNPTFDSMFGYEPGELIGKHVSILNDLTPKENRNLVNEIIEQLNTKGSWSGELFNLRKDGTRFITSAHVSELCLSGKNCWISVQEDITERKRAEEKLRLERDNFVNILDSMEDGVYIVDQSYDIQYVNPALKKEFGPLEGRKCYECFHDRKEICTWCKNKEVFAGKTIRWEWYSAKNEKTYDLIDTPLRNADGSISKLEIFRDITERKKAEDAIHRSKKDWENTFNAISDWVVLMDVKGRILRTNRIGEEFAGVPMDEMVGQTCCKLLHGSDTPLPGCPMLMMFQSGHSETMELQLPLSKRWFAVGVDPVRDENGTIIGAVHIARDITERKEAEEKLLDYQGQLKSLASQLSLAEEHERRRIATELHDQVGQSLVISKLKLETLRESASSVEFGKALEEVCNSLGRTIADTRSLTSELHPPLLSLLGFEMAVTDWLTKHIEEKHGIATEFEDDEQLKPLDDDISILLFRDVRELLTNVVRHAHAKKVKVSIRKVGGQISVSVKDDGVGFDPAKVASMAAEINGFGLFSIQERLEQLGGHFEIESKSGHGTRITITAPLQGTNIAEGRQI